LIEMRATESPLLVYNTSDLPRRAVRYFGNMLGLAVVAGQSPI
jgi:hypothetical protein